MILVSGWVKVCYFPNTCLSCDIFWNLLPNYVSFIKRSFHKSFFYYYFSIVWIVECLINDSQITYYSKRIKTSYIIFFLFLFLFPPTQQPLAMLRTPFFLSSHCEIPILPQWDNLFSFFLHLRVSLKFPTSTVTATTRHHQHPNSTLKGMLHTSRTSI
jgi:hypothetical protein